MREYLLALLRSFVPYIIVGALCLWAGMWIQSGKTPVMPQPITKYIPAPDGYIDLPELTFTPAMRYVILDPGKAEKDTVFKVDTVYAPSSWIGRYDLINTDEAIKLTDDKVYLSYFDPGELNYVIDEYNIPPPSWTKHINISAGTNLLEQPQRLYVGIDAAIYYHQVGVGATLLVNNLEQAPIILAQIKYRFQ